MPPHLADAEPLEALCGMFHCGPVTVLTGAGISTASGIPDYRGPGTRRRARNPVQFKEFLKSPAARKRYWARSMLGWSRFRSAQPNAGHAALAALERTGRLAGLVTQNVDGLHTRAGSEDVIELHGALRRTICLACRAVMSRDALQQALEEKNAALLSQVTTLAPDGDTDLSDELVADFRIVDCACGGPLKPDVVFFGENVPAPRVAQAMSRVERGGGLLVVGSSLAVYSGLRFVRAAHARGLPIAIVTLGETRGDSFAGLRIDAEAGLTLQSLVARLRSTPRCASNADVT